MKGDRYQSGECDRYGDRVEPANRTTAVHPFLFALLPLAAACQTQFPHVAWRELLLPASLMLVPVFGLVVGLATLVPDRQRAALAVSWVLLCLFSQGLLAAFVGRIAPSVPPQALAAALVATCGIGLWMLFKAEWCDESATLFANVAGIAALGAVAGPLGWQSYLAWNAAAEKEPLLVASAGAAGSSLGLPATRAALPAIATAGRRPDLYCLLFHRAGAESVLEKHFRFEQPAFRKRLEQAGFAFPRMPEAGEDAPRAVAALLNAQPIAALPTAPAQLRAALRESEVARRLVAAGYHYHHLGSPLAGLRDSPLACENFSYYVVPSEFDESVLRNSILWPWLTPQGFRSRELGRGEHLLKLIAAPADEPRFVLAHFMLPGEEWKFDADGTALTAEELHDRSPAESYLRQTLFTQHLIEQFVSRILARRDRPAIIVLAGDVPPELPPEAMFRNKGVRPPCDLFAALYLPDPAQRAAIPKTLPASEVFRFLFREYFTGAPARAAGPELPHAQSSANSKTP